MSFFQQLTLQFTLVQLALAAAVSSVGTGVAMQTGSHQRIAGLGGLNGNLHKGLLGATANSSSVKRTARVLIATRAVAVKATTALSAGHGPGRGVLDTDASHDSECGYRMGLS